jgi:PKD repeat protein
MKLTRITLFLYLVTFLAGNASCVTVYIRGTVTDIQGVTPFPHHTIYIKTDFSSPFHYYKILTTDLNGFYADTVLNVPSFPVSFQISTYDCDNALHVQTGLSTNSPIVADFRICVPPYSGCRAGFSYDSISGLNYQFTDQSASNTSVISWNWNFGDPASGTNNGSFLRNPQHIYSGSGIFDVKLLIHSSDGCKDSISQTVFIQIPRDRVTISGQIINDSTGKPIPNQPVMINSTLIQYSDVVYSNVDGFYADTIASVPEGIPISVASYDCHNILHSNTVYASSTPLQVNFHLCLNSQCIADFSAILDSNNQAENTFLFSDRSYGDPNRWNWSFGDGNSSTEKNPTHQYSNQGTYHVCLFITKEDSLGAWTCSDTICQVVTTSFYHNVGGLLFIGHYPINNPNSTDDTGVACLYRIHHQWVTPVDTIRFTYLGYYTFLHVLEGTYIVKAGLTKGSAHYNEYLPTYTDNQVKWQSTGPFVLDKDLFDNHIHLIAANDSLSGPAVLRGSAFHNGNHQKFPCAEVLLFNTNLEPVKATVTDAEGNFEFSALPLGTYYLYPEITGKYARFLTVTLDSNHVVMEGLDLEVFDYDVTGVFPIIPNNEMRVGKAFPNPAGDVVRVAVNSPKTLVMDAEVLTVTGVRITRDSFTVTEGGSMIALSLQNLREGLYFLVLKTPDGNLFNTQKIIKK